jgi:hypothetical protein
MSDEVHPLVALLTARAESNPEEFVHPLGRWVYTIQSLTAAGAMADAEALQKLVAKCTTDKLHARVMEELLNPIPTDSEASTYDYYNKANEYKKQLNQQMAQTQLLAQHAALNSAFGQGPLTPTGAAQNTITMYGGDGGGGVGGASGFAPVNKVSEKNLLDLIKNAVGKK